jgi:hypothetical protein
MYSSQNSAGKTKKQSGGDSTQFTVQEYMRAMDFFYRFRQEYEGGEPFVEMVYAGFVPFDLTNSFINVLAKRLAGVPRFVRIGSRASLRQCAIELFQNVARHGYDWVKSRKDRAPLGLLLFRVASNESLVVTANLCRRELAKQVQERVEFYNSCTYDQIASLFLADRHMNTFSETGGAGLGFLDIRKKSKVSIDVFREPFNDDLDVIRFTVRFPVERAVQENGVCAE